MQPKRVLFIRQCGCQYWTCEIVKLISFAGKINRIATDGLPGYDAFMFRLFFRAQYNAKMAPLINDIPRTPNAIPDIQVVAQLLVAGSVLQRNG